MSLCLGGRSHEAYSCLFVSHSVCYFSFAAHAEQCALKLAMHVDPDITSLLELVSVLELWRDLLTSRSMTVAGDLEFFIDINIQS